MSAQKQELYNIIETLPDELSVKVIDYVEYLKFSYIATCSPESLIIKDKNDLIKKLEKGMQDTENGNISSAEEVFTEIDEILAK